MCIWRSERCKKHKRAHLSILRGRLECHLCLWEKQLEKDEAADKARAKQAQKQKTKPEADTKSKVKDDQNKPKPETQTPSSTPWTPPPISCPRCLKVFPTTTELSTHYYPSTPLLCTLHCEPFTSPNDALNHAYSAPHSRCFIRDCPSSDHDMPGGNDGVYQHILDSHMAPSTVPSQTPEPNTTQSKSKSKKKKREKRKSRPKHSHSHTSRKSKSKSKSKSYGDYYSESEYSYDSYDSDSTYTHKSRNPRRYSPRIIHYHIPTREYVPAYAGPRYIPAPAALPAPELPPPPYRGRAPQVRYLGY